MITLHTTSVSEATSESAIATIGNYYGVTPEVSNCDCDCTQYRLTTNRFLHVENGVVGIHTSQYGVEIPIEELTELQMFIANRLH